MGLLRRKGLLMFRCLHVPRFAKILNILLLILLFRKEDFLEGSDGEHFLALKISDVSARFMERVTLAGLFCSSSLVCNSFSQINYSK